MLRHEVTGTELTKPVYSEPTIKTHTHKGKRDINQDYVWNDQTRNIIIVADGIGSKNYASKCSRMTVETIIPELQTLYDLALEKEDMDTEKIKRYLKRIVEFTNKLITGAGYAISDKGWGTTLDIGLITPKNNKAYFAHVGDGGIYHINRELGEERPSIEKITNEHNKKVTVKTTSGYNLTEQYKSILEATSPLTSYIGMSEPTIDITDINLKPSDAIVIGTDGLTTTVTETEILDTLINNDLETSIKILSEISKNPKRMIDRYNKLKRKIRAKKVILEYDELEIKIENVLGDNTTFAIYGGDRI